MKAPPWKRALLRATNRSPAGTIAPRCRSISSGCVSAAESIVETITPSGSSSGGVRSKRRGAGLATGVSAAGSKASRSRPEMSVNSQPGRPLKLGSSRVWARLAARWRRSVRTGAAALPNRALHLELDQAVHLHRVLHRQLLGDRLDESVDDQLGGLLLGDAV